MRLIDADDLLVHLQHAYEDYKADIAAQKASGKKPLVTSSFAIGMKCAMCYANNAPTIHQVPHVTGIYDKEELFRNCTVQVLTNSATGDTSVGWWPEDGE